MREAFHRVAGTITPRVELHNMIGDMMKLVGFLDGAQYVYLAIKDGKARFGRSNDSGKNTGRRDYRNTVECGEKIVRIIEGLCEQSAKLAEAVLISCFGNPSAPMCKD